MKFIIAQKSSEEHKPLLDISLPNKQAYADMRGYNIYLDGTSYNHSKLDKWMKMESILKCFDIDCEWIFWSDADSVIMNFDISLDDFIKNDNKDLIMSFFPMDDYTRKRMGYQFEYTLHAGNMLIRKSEWAYNFLIDCYNDQAFDADPMSEEAAITDRYRRYQEVRNKIQVIGLDKVCTIPPNPHKNFLKQYTDGDFIVHMLGYPMKEKIQGVKIYAEKAAIKNTKGINTEHIQM